jgi:hypothetical protein
MAKNQIRRLSAAVLDADREAFDALQGITNYAPANPSYATATIKAARDRMDDAQREAIQTEAEAAAKRDALIVARSDFHDAILGAKVQVEAQFGSNSDEFASLGLKKKSAYKTPSRSRKPGVSTK